MIYCRGATLLYTVLMLEDVNKCKVGVGTGMLTYRSLAGVMAPSIFSLTFPYLFLFYLFPRIKSNIPVPISMPSQDMATMNQWWTTNFVKYIVFNPTPVHSVKGRIAVAAGQTYVKLIWLVISWQEKKKKLRYVGQESSTRCHASLNAWAKLTKLTLQILKTQPNCGMHCK